MVNLRCPSFNDVIWMYVAEYASRRGMNRCAALEEIVKEHMKFLSDEHERRTPKE